MTPDPATDPAGYVLAVADVREQRAKAQNPLTIAALVMAYGPKVREHIAAEANPEHALKEVALWRGIIERHTRSAAVPLVCQCHRFDFPCPDLLAVVGAAKAYDQAKELG